MADNEEGEETTSHGNEWEVPKTTDNEEGEEATSRGNGWEVVSLTASAYAAAPGPRGDESIHEEKGATVSENDEGESSRTLFMSGHFVFPPSEHENLPIPPGNMEIHKEDEHVAEMNVHNEDKSEKEEENFMIEGLDMPEKFPDVELFDEKGNMELSIHGPGFDHGLDVEENEPDESTVVSNFEPCDYGMDPSSVLSESPRSGKDDEPDCSELPCGAWWKRRVASWCGQAKETRAFWSVFVAAAVMGLVLLGQRWQQERWQVLQQRWQLSISDEKSGRILSRLKDVIVGGSRRGTYITATSAER